MLYTSIQFYHKQSLNFIGLKTGKNRQDFRTYNDQKQDLKIGIKSDILVIFKNKIGNFQHYFGSENFKNWKFPSKILKIGLFEFQIKKIALKQIK